MKKIKEILSQLRALPGHLLYSRFVRKLLYSLRHFSFPGHKGVPLYNVLRYILQSLFSGELSRRAKAIAFSFIMALPPLLIFLFTLIAYFPVNGIQDEMLSQLQMLLPESVYNIVSDTINDVLGHRHSSLMTISFVVLIFVATKGVYNMLTIFVSHPGVEKRKSWTLYPISLVLVFALFGLIVLMLCFFIGYSYLVDLYMSLGWCQHNHAHSLILLEIGRWVILTIATLLVLSFLYFVAPVKKQRIRFLSPGAILATIMFFLLSWGFEIYIENFNKYNVLYGSIGAILVIMLWIHINCQVLLIGYELNIAIADGSLHNYSAKKLNLFNYDNSEKKRQGGSRRDLQ